MNTLAHLAALGAALMMTSTANARTVAYVSNADSRDIAVLELDEKDGATHVIETVPVSGEVMPLAVSPDRKYLYASLRSEPYSVSSFAIDAKSGRLSLIKTTPLADNMAYISTDRTGRYLFGASYSGNKISVNTVNPNGSVNPEPLAVIPTGKNAHCILPDPKNQFVFASNLGDDQILQFRFDAASGQLSPNDPPATETQPGVGPRHFVFHPTQRLMFCVNELDATLDTYRVDGMGALKRLASTSIMPPGSNAKPWAADVHLTPDGKYLYTSERTTSTLAAFRVEDGNGKLSLIGHVETEEQPRGFAIAPGGKYLLAVGQKSNRLSTYAIDAASGKLRRLSRLEVGRNPNWVEIITLPQ